MKVLLIILLLATPCFAQNYFEDCFDNSELEEMNRENEEYLYEQAELLELRRMREELERTNNYDDYGTSKRIYRR